MTAQPLFSDATEKRALIHRKAVVGVQSLFPIKTTKYTIEVSGIAVQPKDFSLMDVKRAILEGKSLTEPVVGTLTLKDASGKVIDKVPDFRLMSLPFFTQMHTFIVDGNAYSVGNQLRTKPGIYTRVRRNEVPEVAFNLAKGANFKITMDPESSVFRFELGTSRLALYPLLRALGISDGEIGRVWGKDILSLNATGPTEQQTVVASLYGRLIPLKEQSPSHDINEQIKALRAYFDQTVVDPETTKITLGTAYSSVSGHTVLLASGKLLKVFRDEVEHDDRDSLEFQKIHSVDDFIQERLMKGGPEIVKKLILKFDHRSDFKGLRDLIPSAPFSPTVKSLVTQFTLSRTPDQINPLEIMDAAMKVTRLGEGGISDLRAVPDATRDLHVTHLGVLDPIRTPESHAIGVDIRAALGTAKDDHGNIYTLARDMKTDKVRYINTKDLRQSTVAFPNQPMKGQVDVIEGGKIKKVSASKVDFQIPHSQALFGPSAVLVPFIDHMQGNRATMGSKQITQALPLKHREEPLVQVATHIGSEFKTTHEMMGSQIVKRAPEDGSVTKVTDEFIHFKGKSGKEHKISYAQDLPLNSKTYLHEDVIVKAGDSLKRDAQLTESNFTRDGKVALGRNAFVAYMPYHGENSNDALVVSQSAATSFTSMHMYKKTIDLDETTTLDKRFWVTQFPTKFPNESLAKIEQNGLPKKGSKINYGEPLILAVRKSVPSTTDMMLGRLHKSLINKFRDASVIWDHEHPGEVVDIVETPKRIAVTVKMEAPVVVGDKLCYAQDTEFLTSGGWRLVSDITFADKIATLNPVTQALEYHPPDAIHTYPHQGDMVLIQKDQVDHLVTPDHLLWAKLRDATEFSPVPARDLLSRRATLRNHFSWSGETPEFFTLPVVEYLRGSPRVTQVSMPLWLEFLGYYLADGHTNATSVSITKYQSKKPEHHARILEICTAMGFSPYSEPDGRRVTVADKTLCSYLKRLGSSTEKSIPREFLALASPLLRILFNALISCDGNIDAGRIRYFTTSRQLADDVQELSAKLGYSCVIRVRDQSHSKEICGRQLKSTAPLYTVSINNIKGREPYLDPRLGHVALVPYAGTVYCVTVPNHIIYTRRNGKTVFSMNSGVYGNKGVVSRILPDDHMPHVNGKPLDILIASTGVVSRINPGQILETALGKVAKKTGQTIAVDNFSGKDKLQMTKDLLKKHGIPDKETVTDPMTGRKIPEIMVGYQHIMKLFKSTDTNFGARGVGTYDINEQPVQGGSEGAKRLGGMELNALLAHGSNNLVGEAIALKSQKNTDWWNAFKVGAPLPPVKRSFAVDKMNGMLAGAGVRVEHKGDMVRLLPMTDKHVESLSSGAITEPDVLRKKDLKPEIGGLFDPVKTGGLEGEKWSHIHLSEPIVKPVFMKPVASLLRMTETSLGKVLMGKGGHYVHSLLSALNLRKLKEETVSEVNNANGQKLDGAVKRLKFLTGLEKAGMTPTEAYVGQKIVVIPPKMRPVVPGPNNQLLVSDANHLYREVILSDKKLQEMKAAGITHDDDLAPMRQELHSAVSALTGFSEPTSFKLRQQGKKGFIKQIAGPRPSEGYFQEKIYGRPQDLSGRGTIAPDPSLDLHEIGLPEDTAWGIYAPFVVKRLVHMGYRATEAADHVEKRTPAAKSALQTEVKDRPVVYNRAPSLWRYSALAGYPKLIPGKTIRLNPFVETPMGADYDGDAIQLHVPVSPGAVRDAHNITPDKLLFSDKTRNDLIPKPEMEAVIGLYEATRIAPSGKKRKFKTKEDAMQAYYRGELKPNDDIEVG